MSAVPRGQQCVATQLRCYAASVHPVRGFIFLLLGAIGAMPVGCERESSTPRPQQPASSVSASIQRLVPGPKQRAELRNYPSAFQIVSLRGSAVDPFAEGNAIEVLRTTLEQGVEYVEVDFRIAADGVLVSSHDREIYGCGMVATLPSAEARACRLSAGRHLATLGELLSLPFRGIYLDLKDTYEADDAHAKRVVDAVAAEVVRAKRESDAVLMVYRAPGGVRETIRRHGLRAGVKGYPESLEEAEQLVRLAAEARFELVCVNSRYVTRKLVKKSLSQGVWHLPWSIQPGEVDHWKRLAGAGIGGMLVLHYTLVKEHVAPHWSDPRPSLANL